MIHCGVATANAAAASQFHLSQSSTPAALARATKRSGMVPPSPAAPPSTGAASAPRIPSAAIPRDSQRTASAVPIAPTPMASTTATSCGTSEYTWAATVMLTNSPEIPVATLATAASVRALCSWSQTPSASRTADPAAPIAVRAVSPIQPFDIPRAKRKTRPRSTAIPPTQASTRPPSRSSSSLRPVGMRIVGTAGCSLCCFLCSMIAPPELLLTVGRQPYSTIDRRSTNL